MCGLILHSEVEFNYIISDGKIVGYSINPLRLSLRNYIRSLDEILKCYV